MQCNFCKNSVIYSPKVHIVHCPFVDEAPTIQSGAERFYASICQHVFCLITYWQIKGYGYSFHYKSSGRMFSSIYWYSFLAETCATLRDIMIEQNLKSPCGCSHI